MTALTSRLHRNLDDSSDTAPQEAGATIGTLAGWQGESACCFGGGRFGAATIGQVITAPEGVTALRRFSFVLKLPASLAFRGEVYGWDGHTASGSALFESPSTMTSGENDFQEITFVTPDASVVAGQHYVLFITTAGLADVDGQAGAFGLGPAPDGEGFVYRNDRGDARSWTTTPWQPGHADLAFEARFSS
ncbi:MAG TPA: hypothetical protein VFI42_20255 [Thermomicrobiaceae bacterium]|nr:hypothetical protein [Thermomicrobiaceae bacterium]